jgi:short subunit dehydrogenase-like uncharacterized protein
LSKTNIIVFGATGYTGRKMCVQLAKGGLPFVMAARNRDRLVKLRDELKLSETVKVVTADPQNPATLPNLFRDTDAKVIINCVGPFTRYGEPVVKAAVEAGVHYLDITGEQQYLARIIEKYDVLAKMQNVAVIPACGFEYAVNNWLIAAAAEGLDEIERIVSATAARKLKISRGTQLSALDTLAEPGYAHKNGQRVQHIGFSTKEIEFPAPFGKLGSVSAPFGEVITIPRHIKVKNLESYLALGGLVGKAMQYGSFLVPLMVKAGGVLLEKFAKSPHETTIDNSQFALVAEIQSAKGNRRATMTGKGVYDLTAVLVAWCAAQIRANSFEKYGVLGPAQAFDSRKALRYLEETGAIKVSLPDIKV